MIARCFHADKINAFINDPSVRPYVGGNIETAIDLTAAVENDDNVFLTNEAGGFGFIWTAPRTYEVHTFILPEGRGRAAAGMAGDALLWMRGHGARHLWTRVSKSAGNVAKFTTTAGFVAVGQQTLDLGAGPVEYDLYEWRA